MSSEEFAITSYRLEVQLDDHIIADWPTFKLAPGEKWESTLALPPLKATGSVVTAELYRLDQPETIYRQVKLYPNPSP